MHRHLVHATDTPQESGEAEDALPVANLCLKAKGRTDHLHMGPTPKASAAAGAAGQPIKAKEGRGQADERVNLWAEPPLWMIQLVTRLVLTELHWRAALSNVRLVSKAWRVVASMALDVLAPRPFASTSDLLRLPRLFPNLRVLRLQSPTAIPFVVDTAVEELGLGLPHLRSLVAVNPAGMGPHSISYAIEDLTTLWSLELHATDPAVSAAAITALATHNRGITRLHLDGG